MAFRAVVAAMRVVEQENQLSLGAPLRRVDGQVIAVTSHHSSKTSAVGNAGALLSWQNPAFNYVVKTSPVIVELCGGGSL